MLPASWRQQHKIGPSTELLVRQRKSGSLVLETRELGVRRAQALVARYVKRKPGGSVVEEFLAERRREAGLEAAG
jgi:hypothetical protein